MPSAAPSPNPAAPTPYPDLNAILHDLVSGIQAVLGARCVGVYLQGSFALGDFDAHSDVDFVVAIADELTAAEVEALQALHARIYDGPAGWAQHLEGSYFPLAVLRTPDPSGQTLWYLDNGSRALKRSDHCNTVVVRWTVREHGVTLAGPPPSTLIDSIPVDVLRAYVLADLLDWGREILAQPERFANHFYQGFIVLSYCRMLRELHMGALGSKRAGAEWAKANLDPAWAGLIDRAWSGRPNPAVSVRTPADPAEFAATLDFVRYVSALAPDYPLR